MPPRMSYGSEKDRIVSSMILPTIFQAVLLFAVFLLETTLPSGNSEPSCNRAFGQLPAVPARA